MVAADNQRVKTEIAAPPNPRYYSTNFGMNYQLGAAFSMTRKGLFLWPEAKLEDPRSRGKALTGNLAGVWRYRVGDYRILCDINDGRLVILVVDVAHRREVYKRR